MIDDAGGWIAPIFIVAGLIATLLLFGCCYKCQILERPRQLRQISPIHHDPDVKEDADDGIGNKLKEFPLYEHARL